MGAGGVTIHGLQNDMFAEAGISVRAIAPCLAHPFILRRHYAKRLPPISYAFGLYDGGCLVGVVTYGTPSSSPLRAGVCGPEYSDIVLELNRLCLLNNGKNEASKLVGASLKMLPRPAIVVSFADIAAGHVGTVYQASNFLYTGLSAKRTDWAVTGSSLHGQTIADEFRGSSNRAAAMRKKYGDAFHLVERSRKHRYVKFIGTKGQRAAMLRSLRYPVAVYPRGAAS